MGNLRTALLAWLFARTSDRAFWIRMENLDRTAVGSDQRQLADLAALGLEWDEPVVYQTDRLDIYRGVIDDLTARGATFECFCTRREILEAPSAPHAPQGAYPGTCRDLTPEQRAEKIAAGRPPAIRLLSDVDEFTILDTQVGSYTGMVDDFVICRNDGTPAYNLAVVVDDAAQGVDQVVRGDDLLSSAPRQAYLAQRLGHTPPTYSHVPMVLNAEHVRLSKRDGAVTLADLAEHGITAADVLSRIATSLGMATPGERVDIGTLATRFDPGTLPREPWIVDGVV